ncbi:hypothetical protein O181_026111 [Austropuccinia psidii MF-1]|uniref:Uncharacterized protein n=1 Tax=Austropuccinia psidii MF-1 TaxID=1389203 RepID=A0A9Q3CPS1_9BASI|nr:hypothetical protein [Austropuccinia psidii MF-1]
MLIRTAYKARPRAREALEIQSKELMYLGFLRKVGHNEKVEVATPFVIACNNGKSRMVGDFKALNNYSIPERYPIPRIYEKLMQLSQVQPITAMGTLKGFNPNSSKENSPELLSIIVHSGIYGYLGISCGIKNALLHYNRMMNTILP